MTGAESATAVNNNAAATVLVLRALCQNKEVIISRGQLIEIGGSFRIPEIMAVSGAMLREVGTTNITRFADYESAVGPHTGRLATGPHQQLPHLRLHRKSVPLSSNSRPSAKKHNLLVIDDVGSGALLDFSRFGFQGEPVAKKSIARSEPTWCYSAGDKLLVWSTSTRSSPASEGFDRAGSRKIL